VIKVLDLFSGIGGFAIASELVGGFETVAFCEIDPYCRQILNLRYPGIPIFEDVRTITAQSLRDAGIINIEAVFGGFPCQNISSAGNREGLLGDRSSLFFEIIRIVRFLQPQFIVLENVSALLVRGMERVLWELAQVGYDAEWSTLSCAEVGGCHRRDRIWIIAYPNRLRKWESEG
jgi:DNA (cytosine-5)-methyltransferase 1